jgi:hypothetical protein
MTHFETLLQDVKKDQVRDQIWDQAQKQVWYRHGVQVRDQIWGQVWRQVRVQVCNYVDEELNDPL